MKQFTKFGIYFSLVALLASGCSSSESENTYVPPSASSLQSYLNSGWGEPACTRDGCFSIKAISVEQTEKP